MLQPQRTRSLRRVKKKTPSGQVKIYYSKRKNKMAHCSRCGKELHGVPRTKTLGIRKVPKTGRRPERAYGGVLCSVCSRKIIVEKAKGMLKGK